MRTFIIPLLLTFAAFCFTGCQVNEDLEPAAKSSNGLNDADGIDSQRHGKAFEYTAELYGLNNSGVSGTAWLTMYRNGDLTVHISATGLEADMLHVQHIHGFDTNNGNSICPPDTADTDGDGLISVGEGAPFYGGVLLSLAEFPTADSDGNIDYMASFETTGDLRPLQNRSIVLHGLTVEGEYIASLPVACGQIGAPMPVNN